MSHLKSFLLLILVFSVLTGIQSAPSIFEIRRASCCPPDVYVVSCYFSPCFNRNCTNYPLAKCYPNYCGGCRKYFYNKGWPTFGGGGALTLLTLTLIPFNIISDSPADVEEGGG
ncbi:unnamed protein product [Gordionus sp. m RMFG-2023]